MAQGIVKIEREEKKPGIKGEKGERKQQSVQQWGSFKGEDNKSLYSVSQKRTELADHQQNLIAYYILAEITSI